MRTYSGSLQRRGKRYYLVIHRGGRQRWLALKTDKLSEARVRAAQLAPRDPDDETAWLEQLIREGEMARVRLARRRAVTSLTWEALAAFRLNVADVESSSVSRECHRRWLEILQSAAQEVDSGHSPGALTAIDAGAVTEKLHARYISARRMISYYRRVWRMSGLDDGIWAAVSCRQVCEKSKERYRRLSLEEIRSVHGILAKRSSPLADMLLIGYATGLRLSDVAELERSEISLPFLHVCPNKTRYRKPVPLKIPMTGLARQVVERLLAEAERLGRRYLFGDGVRHRPSRKLSKAFRLAGVLKTDNGRASFHSLRATFISLMDDAGVSPYVTDSITGHGGGGMHARYSQPSDEALLTAVARAIPDLELDKGRA